MKPSFLWSRWLVFGKRRTGHIICVLLVGGERSKVCVFAEVGR